MKTMQVATYLVHMQKMHAELALMNERNKNKPIDEQERGMAVEKWPDPNDPAFPYAYGLRFMAKEQATAQFATFISAIRQCPDVRVVRRGKLNTDILFTDGRVIDGAAHLLRFELYPIGVDGSRQAKPVKLTALNPVDIDMHVYTEDHELVRLRSSTDSDFWGSLELNWTEEETT